MSRLLFLQIMSTGYANNLQTIYAVAQEFCTRNMDNYCKGFKSLILSGNYCKIFKPTIFCLVQGEIYMNF